MADPQPTRPRTRPGRIDRSRSSVPDLVTDRTPVPLAGSARRTRVAFYGRSACRQGAHLALTRQLGSVRAALPTGAVIVGCFADVCAWDGWAETSCADLSICTGWVLDTHTIEGGLATVLRRARRPVPDFEVLACEDTDRLSRRTFRRTLIEDALEACGLGLVFAADGRRGLLPLAAEPTDARDTIGRAARRPEGVTTWPLPS